MNQPTYAPSEGPWTSEAQRATLPRYLSMAETLAAAAPKIGLDELRRIQSWVHRELELATLRLYGNREEFEDEMSELMRELSVRLDVTRG